MFTVLTEKSRSCLTAYGIIIFAVPLVRVQSACEVMRVVAFARVTMVGSVIRQSAERKLDAGLFGRLD